MAEKDDIHFQGDEPDPVWIKLLRMNFGDAAVERYIREFWERKMRKDKSE